MKPILIIGANGQIGSELSTALIDRLGREAVILSDIYAPETPTGIFEIIDILKPESVELIIKKYDIKTVVNLAAVLSAKGEQNPLMTWRVNVDGLLHLLELARTYQFQLFHPSTIAVFGPDSDKNNVGQNSHLHPSTMYGVTKVSGESLCYYYATQYGVDVRSIRIPGVIGGYGLPGGGTTDYAVDIFHEAIKSQRYTCFLSEDTRLPMIYMDDTIDAIIDLMSTRVENITVRTSYNIQSMSFTPGELAEEIRLHIPDFKISYIPDQRQKIADSWPQSINDYISRRDWDW
ncbi:UNVERIFIED_CONTAM: hypothetical protein GTU68_025865, partial [Idotea baltica]|nr:hypothetical protein [Idotea baltica]